MDLKFEWLKKQLGLRWDDFGDPHTRIHHSRLMDTLKGIVRLTNDAAIGLRAGSSAERGDLYVVEYAARSAATLGEGIRCLARYFRILHEAADLWVEADGDDAIWSMRVTDGVAQPPAANDFMIASMLAFVERNVIEHEPPREIWLMHPLPAHAAAEEKAFGAPVKHGMSCNAIVVRAAAMNRPLRGANSSILREFETYAQQVLAALLRGETFTRRVREDVVRQLRMGPASMESAARTLAMSTSTLRRRLLEEEATFTDILDDVRRRLADHYLTESTLPMRQIAALLGFADAPAFNRAFKRWTGLSPAVHRTRVCGDVTLHSPATRYHLSS